MSAKLYTVQRQICWQKTWFVANTPLKTNKNYSLTKIFQNFYKAKKVLKSYLKSFV